MQRIRHALLSATLALAGALAIPAGADPIYKWVDDKGVTHYGEKAPADAKSAKVKVGDTTSSDAEDEIKRLNERRSAAEAAKKKAEEGGDSGAGTKAGSAAPSADDKARASTVCDQHRKNLEALKSGKRVRALGDDGKPRALNQDEVAAQIKFAEDELQRCEQLQKMQETTNKAPPAAAR